MTKGKYKCRIMLGDSMKSKDKKRKHAKISIKNILVLFATVTFLLCLVACYNYYFAKNEVLAKETSSETNSENVKISNAGEINLEELISTNTKKNSTEEYVTEETDLEYITKYQSNPELPTGVMQVIQEGREGKQEVTTKKVYEGGQVVSEEQVSSKVTKASVNKIVEVGSGRGTSSYKVKAGDTVYVTSDRAEIRVEPNEESQKVATLTKGNELSVLSVQDSWYQISGSGARGYIKSENTTYINPNKSYDEEEQSSSGSGGSIASPSFDMALNKPSGLSLEQFKKVLTDSKDTNKVMQNNAEYFYYIEQQYNINGVFVAAVAIHESAWGTSKISQNKHNLFGYGAYDSNPYNGAYEFSNYSESIDLIARVFVKYYLNPKGTSIYGGEQASGKYYNGPTLSGVNTKYATDKNWANAVYNHMKYLYNKL